MTIRISKDVENAINAAVQSGRFASADKMIAKLVREEARRSRQPKPPRRSPAKRRDVPSPSRPVPISRRPSRNSTGGGWRAASSTCRSRESGGG